MSPVYLKYKKTGLEALFTIDDGLYLKYRFSMTMTLREWVRETGGGKAAAEAAGVSEVSIWKYLSGERRPSPEVAERIEHASGGRVRKESLIWPDAAA